MMLKDVFITVILTVPLILRVEQKEQHTKVSKTSLVISRGTSL